MARFRDRRRRGRAIVNVGLDQVGMSKLVSLGYLDPAQREQRSALSTAAEAYLSDELAEEPI